MRVLLIAIKMRCSVVDLFSGSYSNQATLLTIVSLSAIEVRLFPTYF